MNNSLKMLLVLICLLFLGCNSTIPNTGVQESKPNKKLDVKRTLVWRQYLPKSKDMVSFGFAMKVALVSEIVPYNKGYFIDNGTVTVHLNQLDQEDLIANQISGPRLTTETTQLVQNSSGFFSKVTVFGKSYSFSCSGDISQKLCEEMLTSLQIIKQQNEEKKQ